MIAREVETALRKETVSVAGYVQTRRGRPVQVRPYKRDLATMATAALMKLGQSLERRHGRDAVYNPSGVPQRYYDVQAELHKRGIISNPHTRGTSVTSTPPAPVKLKNKDPKAMTDEELQAAKDRLKPSDIKLIGGKRAKRIVREHRRRADAASRQRSDFVNRAMGKNLVPSEQEGGPMDKARSIDVGAYTQTRRGKIVHVSSYKRSVLAAVMQQLEHGGSFTLPDGQKVSKTADGKYMVSGPAHAGAKGAKMHEFGSPRKRRLAAADTVRARSAATAHPDSLGGNQAYIMGSSPDPKKADRAERLRGRQGVGTRAGEKPVKRRTRPVSQLGRSLVDDPASQTHPGLKRRADAIRSGKPDPVTGLTDKQAAQQEKQIKDYQKWVTRNHRRILAAADKADKKQVSQILRDAGTNRRASSISVDTAKRLGDVGGVKYKGTDPWAPGGLADTSSRRVLGKPSKNPKWKSYDGPGGVGSYDVRPAGPARYEVRPTDPHARKETGTKVISALHPQDAANKLHRQRVGASGKRDSVPTGRPRGSKFWDQMTRSAIESMNVDDQRMIQGLTVKRTGSNDFTVNGVSYDAAGLLRAMEAHQAQQARESDQRTAARAEFRSRTRAGVSEVPRHVSFRDKNPSQLTVAQIRRLTPTELAQYLQVVADSVQSTVFGDNRVFRFADSYRKKLKRAGFKLPGPKSTNPPPGFQD